MYGLAYCKLDYDFLMELELDTLVIYLKSEIDREIKEYDMSMKALSWQTSHLMNATGNFKSPVKPTKLYSSIIDEENKKPVKKFDIEAERKELLKTFGLKG